MPEEIVLKRDLVRTPKRFIDYRRAAGLPIPSIVHETSKGRFVSYYFRRDDPALEEVVEDAKRWVEPDGPFRRGDVVKAARYFLKAVKGDGATQLRTNIRVIAN